MDQMKGFRIAARFEKSKLLGAINCAAALSIFFFGYDQGSAFCGSSYILPRLTLDTE